jgi:flagellin-like protein
MGKEDKNMKNEQMNEEAVSPVIATILMVAITVVLAGVLYVWASSLAEGNAQGDFSMYQFTGKDVTSEAGELGSDTDDELVRMTMDRGDDIQWSRLSIRIEVNGEAPRTCANPGQDSANNDCVIVDNGADTTDQDFAAGDSFTIQEDGQDICDGTQQCEVVVTIVESVLGETIDTTTVMAS